MKIRQRREGNEDDALSFEDIAPPPPRFSRLAKHPWLDDRWDELLVLARRVRRAGAWLLLATLALLLSGIALLAGRGAIALSARKQRLEGES